MADAVQERDPPQVLRQEIIGDAQRQADRLLRRARQEGANILAQARSEADSESQRTLEQARAAAARRIALTLAKVPVEVGRMRAMHIEALLAGLREQALLKFAAGHGTGRRHDLLALVAEAVQGMEGESFVVRLTPAGRQALGAAADWLPALRARTGKAELRISPGPDLAPDENGSIVSDGAGRQLWDNRLAARLERMWPALRIAIAERLGLLG